MRLFLMSLAALFFSLLLFTSCDQDPDDEKPVDDGAELRITSFVFEDFDPPIETEIDSVEKKIHASLPRSASFKSLTPTIDYTEGAELTPPSGYAYDFTSPLDFTLEKDDQSVTYTAHIDTAESDSNELKKISFPSLYIDKNVNDNQINIAVPYGTDLSSVKVNFKISDYANVEPASGSEIDLSTPIDIIVTSESGEEQIYELRVEEKDQPTAVRAFWIPTPAHSPFLKSYEDIREGVAFAKEHNFNALYVCAWANNKTLYPSQTLLDNSSYTSFEESMFHDYTGGSGDPLTDLIEEAHANDIKVILWYEYGFMALSGTPPTQDNNPVLEVHPDWVGINNEGNQANYNDKDYYFNAYNPEVQQFMEEMIMEAVINYDIDGIQGDDRMPAMPRNSGYDDVTVDMYEQEFGTQPPDDYNNSDWVRWRADILNDHWKELYETIKAEDPNCVVACAPNPYPWAFDNLMQEWPKWLDEGTVDLLSVQCYRTTLSDYETAVDGVLHHFTAHGSGNLQRLNPGLIIYGSSGLIDPGVLASQVQYNREVDIPGETFFYDKPMRRDTIKSVLRAIYPGEAVFPDFMAD